MTKKLKVYGGLKFRSDGQHRVVIATSSKAKLAELLGTGIYVVNMRWGETRNQEEVGAAMRQPGVFVDMGKI